MYQRIKNSRENEKGFTLIELLIVVVILGILAAVVIFASAGFKDKGALESCRVNQSSIKTATEAFHSDSPTSAYPDAPADIAPYFDANGVTVGATAVTGKGWKFGYTFDPAGVIAPTLASGGGATLGDPAAICTKP
jgi:prepilin-type N-terminal cleavage/methylation domain-containing protein